MEQRHLFEKASFRAGKSITHLYSTSFSMGIRLLGKKLHDPIYAIYGYVRLADEIVDTFHDQNKPALLAQLRLETWDALERGFSLNPVIHAFQMTVRKFGIPKELVAQFLKSMEMDLEQKTYDRAGFDEYVLGSAEVVGLMCLKVFCEGDSDKFEQLKPAAMRLGAAFQKINFLRDLNADSLGLGRSYFPNVDLEKFSDSEKKQIELEIEQDFQKGYEGVRRLPPSSRFGVYVAYRYYWQLFQKIRRLPPKKVMTSRVRIPNQQKYLLLLQSYFMHSINAL